MAWYGGQQATARMLASIAYKRAGWMPGPAEEHPIRSAYIGAAQPVLHVCRVL